MKPLIVLATLLLVGCASSAGVVQVGPDTYKIASTAITSFGGSATATKDAYRQVAAKCEQQGKQLQLVEQRADAQFTQGSVDITFKCIPK